MRRAAALLLLLVPLACDDPSRAAAFADAERDLADAAPRWRVYNYRCERGFHIDVDPLTGLPLECIGECGDRGDAVAAQIESYNVRVKFWLAAGGRPRRSYRDAMLGEADLRAALEEARPLEGASVSTQRVEASGFTQVAIGDRTVSVDSVGEIRVMACRKPGVALIQVSPDLVVAYHLADGMTLQIWRRRGGSWAAVPRAEPVR